MRYLRVGVPAVIAVLALIASQAAFAQNNVRIVQLSLVSGAVQVSVPGKSSGNASPGGWAPALLNAPVIQGEHIRTLASGRVEIQFEHGSTLRLIPGSEVGLTQLARSDKNDLLTTARLISGTAFVTLRKDDSKAFTFLLPNEDSVRVDGSAAFRADNALVSVFSGKAQVHSAGRVLTLDKNEQIAVAPQLSQEAAALAGTPDPWTEWSRKRDDYYNRAFQQGIEAGGLTTAVNWWDTDGQAMPDYTAIGLTYDASADCQWSMARGDYAGWCWSPSNGWYLPASAIAQVATVANAQQAVYFANGGYGMPGFGFGGCGFSGFASYGWDPMLDGFGGCGYSDFGYFGLLGQPTVIVANGGGGTGVPNGIRGAHHTGLRVGPGPHPKFRTAGNRLAPPPATHAVAHFLPSGVRVNRTAYRVAANAGGFRGSPNPGFRPAAGTPYVARGSISASSGSFARASSPSPSMGSVRAGGSSGGGMAHASSGPAPSGGASHVVH